jgi:L-erythro-3,5-diaminohexanoate dehydrogenase
MKAVETHVVGDPLGTHRVIQPSGAMPQMAWKLDNDVSRLYSNEVVLDVEALSIDAASFRQIEMSSSGDESAIVRAITRTIASRGKQHNPVTGSGGVLMGKVSAVGPAAAAAPKIGERLVSLASLTGTPLRLDKVKKVHRAAGQLEIKGQAVIFESYPYARVPAELPPPVGISGAKHLRGARARNPACVTRAECADLWRGWQKRRVVRLRGARADRTRCTVGRRGTF